MTAIPAPSGHTAVLGYITGDDDKPVEMFALPVVAYHVVYNDFEDKMVGTPLVPSEDECCLEEIGSADYKWLQYPGCEPSDYTAKALALFKQRHPKGL